MLGYHAKEDPSVRPRFTYVEGRLNWLVSVPGLVLTVACGLWLMWLWGLGWFRVATWMHIKLTLVTCVLVIHGVLTVSHRRISRQRPDEPLRRGKFAALHGMVGLLLIAIVILACLRPMSQR
jgi:putative membrane protein